MRDVVAIVETAFDMKAIAREVRRCLIAAGDSEQDYRRALLELGQALVKAKRACRHGEWTPFLEAQGIDERNARHWMALAQHVKSEPGSDLPSRRQVAAASARDDDDDDDEPNPAETKPPPRPNGAPTKIDLDREIVGIHMKIVKVMTKAEAWPKPARSALAHELRCIADTFEEMIDD